MIDQKIGGNLSTPIIKRLTHGLVQRLDRIVKGSSPCKMMDDFHINLMNYDSNVETTQYLDMVTIHGFSSVVLMPTRITSTSAALIDHINFHPSSLNSQS